MSLSKLHAVVKDREVWYATVYGVAKSQTWLSDWTTTIYPSEVKNPHSHKAFPWIFVAALFVVTALETNHVTFSCRMDKPTMDKHTQDWRESHLVQSLWETICGFYQTYNRAIALLGTSQVKCMLCVQKAIRECSQHSSTTGNNHVTKSQTPFFLFDGFQAPSFIFCLLSHSWTSCKKAQVFIP